MVLINRLESFAKDNQLIDNTQIGFKKGSRTVDHKFILTTLIDKYVKKLKSPLYVCFVDFKKAYDSVWRQALLYKLLRLNINGLFFSILKSMYGNNEMCVRVSNSHRSHFFTSNVGVRQGDAISPILFNLYVSDFQSYIGFETDALLLDTSFVNCLMYADDLVVIFRSEVGLQGLIDKLGDYCKRWRMEVNTDKTKIIKFSGNGHCCKTTFFYWEKLIENVINYKYLGLVFNAAGTWSNAMDNLSTRGLKALFSLKRYICTGNIKARLGMILFDQMIKPSLCYASEIWSACDLAKRKFRTGDGFAKYLDSITIEKVYVKFCKFILGVNKRAVKGELGRFPVSVSYIIQTFKYWYHLQESSNSLLREVSSVCRDIHLDTILNRTHRIWYTKIRISNHRFAVETGRFSKIPRDERLCLFCKKQTNSAIEDEKHVLLSSV